MNLRMFLVPVSVRLERSCRLDNRKIVAGSAHKLQPDGEILLSESARNGHCWKPTNIANAAERIGKYETSFEIQRQRCRWNRLRSGGEHVKRLEQGIHSFLSDFPHLESL